MIVDAAHDPRRSWAVRGPSGGRHRLTHGHNDHINAELLADATGALRLHPADTMLWDKTTRNRRPDELADGRIEGGAAPAGHPGAQPGWVRAAVRPASGYLYSGGHPV